MRITIESTANRKIISELITSGTPLIGVNGIVEETYHPSQIEHFAFDTIEETLDWIRQEWEIFKIDPTS